MPHVPAGYPIERLCGPEVVGYLLHWGLFGTLTVQLYMYYLAFPKDKRYVYGLYIVEFVQCSLLTMLSHRSVGSLSPLWVLLVRPASYARFVLLNMKTAACVGHAFYAYRIFILSKSRIVPAFVICVSLTSFVAAIITSIYFFQAGDITKLNTRKTSISSGIACGGAAFCDIIVAVYMTYFQYWFPSHPTSGHKVNSSHRLILAVVTLTSLILFLLFPLQTFYTTPALVVSKMYANTIYMVLNSRIRIMGERDIYTSSTDMGLTITVTEDITSHSIPRRTANASGRDN
ncbi:hypothetical protein F5146DRAFT_1133490 [Armillaria mellea]|nr:hypothetical protein F5146DRAFT_1133490 [Armillaria mellea]